MIPPPMRAPLFVAGVILTLGAVALAEPDAGTAAPVVATLQRGACLGPCPMYAIAIHSDGTVEYEGRRWVKVTGHAVGKISAHELVALRSAFRKAGYFALDGKYDCYDETDDPTAITYFHDGSQERTVFHYYGCSRAPEKLTRLENRIDELVHIEKWIGSQADRLEIQRQWRLSR
jgi:hypothetical protein